MITETAKMIYPQESIAGMIAEKLIQSTGKKHIVVKVTTGWQVCPVKVYQSSMPPKTPAPVKKPSITEVDSPDVVVVEFKFHSESLKYLNIIKDGKVLYLGKSNLIAWETTLGEGEDVPTVKIKMNKAYAKKRGLI